MNNELLQAAKDQAAREVGYNTFEELLSIDGYLSDNTTLINRAMEIYASKQQAYWEQRCKLAEICLEETPCDPDITEGQIDAWRNYHNFIKTTKP